MLFGHIESLFDGLRPSRWSLVLGRQDILLGQEKILGQENILLGQEDSLHGKEETLHRFVFVKTAFKKVEN